MDLLYALVLFLKNGENQRGLNQKRREPNTESIIPIKRLKYKHTRQMA